MLSTFLFFLFFILCDWNISKDLSRSSSILSSAHLVYSWGFQLFFI
jgi:hypothetical protein